MSRAIASARQRRAGITAAEPVPPPLPAHSAHNSSQQGLTLPQVISLVDARLIKLEKFMTDSQQQPHAQSQSQPQQPSQSTVQSAMSDEIVDEFQTRFDILAREISDLKDIVLNLQRYTMEVNKILLEERTSTTLVDNTFTLQGVDFNPSELTSLEESE